MPKRTYDRFLARTGHPIRSLYGSTEAGSIAMNAEPKELVEYSSVGLPLKNVTIEIRNAEAGDGEIWVKSPTIPGGGYENRPDLTRSVFRDGFYHTGRQHDETRKDVANSFDPHKREGGGIVYRNAVAS